jgi:hypothetical protein
MHASSSSDNSRHACIQAKHVGRLSNVWVVLWLWEQHRLSSVILHSQLTRCFSIPSPWPS